MNCSGLRYAFITLVVFSSLNPAWTLTLTKEEFSVFSKDFADRSNTVLEIKPYENGNELSKENLDLYLKLSGQTKTDTHEYLGFYAKGKLKLTKDYDGYILQSPELFQRLGSYLNLLLIFKGTELIDSVKVASAGGDEGWGLELSSLITDINRDGKIEILNLSHRICDLNDDQINNPEYSDCNRITYSLMKWVENEERYVSEETSENDPIIGKFKNLPNQSSQPTLPRESSGSK